MRTVVDQAADIGEVLLTEEQIQAQGRGARAPRSALDMAGRQLTLVSVLKGSLPFMADLMRAISAAAPDRPHGGLVLRRRDDGVVGPRPDPEGPVVEHRGRGRPDRRGHHRHRPDAATTWSATCAARTRVAADLHAPRQAGPAARRDRRRLHRASRSRTSSSSATGSTTASCTGTSGSWASSAPRSTRQA